MPHGSDGRQPPISQGEIGVARVGSTGLSTADADTTDATGGIDIATAYELVRPATPADRTAVEDVVHQAYEPWVARIGARPGPLDADYASLIAAGSVYVTGADDLDGLIVVVPEEGVLLVENVAVRPDRQGQGIGRRLLAFAESEAQRLGLGALRLFTHIGMTSNIQLYQALGYVVTGYQPVDVGHLVHFRKDLVPPASPPPGAAS